jgi:chromate transporter
MRRVAETFWVFLLLGLTSFGGPIAHLGYFHAAFVTRRKWLSEADYADLVALCQFLPGPASSQVGIAIGHLRAGLPGAIVAFVAFTAPSVVLLYLFWLGIGQWSGAAVEGVLHGLKVAALAVIAQAIWQMSQKLAPDWPRRLIALAAAALVLLVPFNATAILVIAVTIVAGSLLPAPPASMPTRVGRHPAALTALIAFAALLVLLPFVAGQHPIADLIDRFYRTGSLVFGGGHVVLPLLETELVAPGLISRDAFLAGYGAAQIVPGPLFSFAFYAGAALAAPPNGIAGGLLALAAIYLPSFLLVLGALPYWSALRTLPRLRSALDLANAAVVGLLLAALIDPVFPAAVRGPFDLALAAAALAALLLHVPPWLVVLACAGAGIILP